MEHSFGDDLRVNSFACLARKFLWGRLTFHSVCRPEEQAFGAISCGLPEGSMFLLAVQGLSQWTAFSGSTNGALMLDCFFLSLWSFQR